MRSAEGREDGGDGEGREHVEEQPAEHIVLQHAPWVLHQQRALLLIKGGQEGDADVQAKDGVAGDLCGVKGKEREEAREPQPQRDQNGRREQQSRLHRIPRGAHAPRGAVGSADEALASSTQ